ncbi:MAG: toxin TumE [Candidatus Competibacteraceae bacterium]
MLHKRLADYFSAIESAVQRLTDERDIERYEEEVLTPDRVNLRLRLRFANGRLLEVSEALVATAGGLQTLGYRYHCQDRQQALVFRYDDTPHFPGLATFPHHKHLPEQVITATKPALMLVLEEAAMPASSLPDQP